MPADMAMHQPGPRVIGLEPDHKIPGGRQHGHVSPRGIRQRETNRRVGVGSRALSQDVEIMAMEMDRVGYGLRGGNDEVDHLVCCIEFDNVGGGGEVCAAFEDLEESWVIPFDGERGCRHIPLEQVVRFSNCDCFSILDDVASGIKCKVGDEISHVFIIAAVGISVSRRIRLGSVSRIVFHYASDVVGVVVVAAGNLGDGSDPVISSCLVGIDDNIVALAHADAEDSGVVGNNWDKINCHDGEAVAINHKFPLRPEVSMLSS